MIMGVTENRTWIKLFYEGDLVYTKSIDLAADTILDILVEEIPHKTTHYQYPLTLIYFDRPCDVEICREGNNVVVRGCKPSKTKGSRVKGLKGKDRSHFRKPRKSREEIKG